MNKLYYFMSFIRYNAKQYIYNTIICNLCRRIIYIPIFLHGYFFSLTYIASFKTKYALKSKDFLSFLSSEVSLMKNAL